MKKEGDRPVTEVLMPEREVRGFKIRPWTWRETEDPELEALLGKMAADLIGAGFDDSNIANRLREAALLLRPYAPAFVAKGIRRGVEEVRDLPAPLVGLLFLHVLDVNLDYVKNLFGLDVPLPEIPGIWGSPRPSSS